MKPQARIFPRLRKVALPKSVSHKTAKRAFFIALQRVLEIQFEASAKQRLKETLDWIESIIYAL